MEYTIMNDYKDRVKKHIDDNGQLKFCDIISFAILIMGYIGVVYGVIIHNNIFCIICLIIMSLIITKIMICRRSDYKKNAIKYIEIHNKKMGILYDTISDYFSCTRENVYNLIAIYESYVENDYHDISRYLSIVSIFVTCIFTIVCSLFQNDEFKGVSVQVISNVVIFIALYISAILLLLYIIRNHFSSSKDYGAMVKDLREMVLYKNL